MARVVHLKAAVFRSRSQRECWRAEVVCDGGPCGYQTEGYAVVKVAEQNLGVEWENLL